MDLKQMLNAAKDPDEKELRRIRFRRERGVSMWDDDKRYCEIRRRMVDREFERQESERGGTGNAPGGGR
jgi:hypothetical protein